MTVEIGVDERVALTAIYRRLLDESWAAAESDWWEDERVARAKMDGMDIVLAILGLAFEVEPGHVTVELVEVSHGGEEA